MTFTVNMDVSKLLKNNDLTSKNIAYGVVNAINKAAIEFQAKARENLKARFTVRQAGMEKLAAVIKPFANVKASRPFAEVSVGQKRGLLLGDFERGAAKRSQIGSNVAVPLTGTPARPGFAAPVTQNLRITALSFKQSLNSAQKKEQRAIKGIDAKATRAARKEYRRQQAAGSKKPWRGNQRTYLIPGRGVFQRTGGSGQGKKSGGSTTRKIYSFLAAPTLKPQMHFLDLAHSDGQRILQSNAQSAITEEIRKRK
jgi:hypothetical protein